MPRSSNGMMQGTHSNQDRLTTIQQTHKRIKFKVLLSALMFWFEVDLFATASTPDDLQSDPNSHELRGHLLRAGEIGGLVASRLIIKTYNRQHRRNRA